MAVTWSLGEHDSLKRYQVFRKEVVLREPAAKRILGQAASGQSV